MPKPKIDQKKASWDRKKTAIMRQYKKMQVSEKGKSFNHRGHNKQKPDEKLTFFKKAMQEYEFKKAIKDEQKQKREAKRKEREEAIRKYNEKKRENFKKLSKKTKWGQPVMGARMEILLERIQRSVDNEAIK